MALARTSKFRLATCS
ncbi:unnamed protein product, partial [Rotaria sp. Silwood2]